MIKTGTRLESQVCDTQVVVISSGESLRDLRCGGAPMVDMGDAKESGAVLDDGLADGATLGKRYVAAGGEEGPEVLVTKAGRGTLTIGDLPMRLKEASALPASD